MPEIVTIDILQVVNPCAARRNVDADPAKEKIAPEFFLKSSRHIVINRSVPVYQNDYCTKSTEVQWVVSREVSYMLATMNLLPRRSVWGLP